METLLRKYLWAIDLAVIAICAIFSARATATAIETKLARGALPAKAGAARRLGRAADRVRQAVRGHPQAQRLLLDLPADPAAAGGDTSGPPQPIGAPAHDAAGRAARHHVRAAAR